MLPAIFEHTIALKLSSCILPLSVLVYIFNFECSARAFNFFLFALVALAWDKADLVVQIVVDYAEALLLDVANDGGTRGTGKRQTEGVGVVDRNEII